jgi:hypothetical protein
MRRNLDVTFATLATPEAVMTALTNQLKFQLDKHGHDWLLWQAVNKYVMALFVDGKCTFTQTTADNRTFRFCFEPSDSNDRHSFLQVTEVTTNADGAIVNRLVWYMPIVSFTEPTPALFEHIYPITPNDAAIMRVLFLSRQTDRAQLSRVFARPSTPLQAAD